MTQCEWITSDTDLSEEKFCECPGFYSVTLKGSNSASNIFCVCVQHVKRYRDKKFVEATFGKGAQVEIRDERHWKKKKGNWHGK